jgi:putative FmdB family regulatory protein
MPIYAYKCSACGHADDVLQKISAAPLTVCPACGQSTYCKQVTAPQFQLKGSGWYVTDFRGGNAPSTTSDSAAKADAEPTSGGEAKTETAAACPVHSAPAATPAAAPAPASKPAATTE